MSAKFYKTTTNKCPWCGEESPKTGNTCGHLYKITVKGVYYWFWHFRPLSTEQRKFYE